MPPLLIVSTLLEILPANPPCDDPETLRRYVFQPFLRFYLAEELKKSGGLAVAKFQPFLRFYCSCAWFLWVFKFFFGFL